MLTASQQQKAIRSGEKLAKEWSSDVAKTGRTMDAERVQRIASQDARYIHHDSAKQQAHANIVARILGRALLPSAEYIAMIEAMA